VNDTIGIYYEVPDGRVAYVFRWNRGVIGYYFNDGFGSREATEEEFQTWKPRRELRDFQDQKDFRLPYVFDLLWDIKRVSQLRYALEHGHEDETSIREEMARCGITVREMDGAA
jgi:hypothetical protein